MNKELCSKWMPDQVGHDKVVWDVREIKKIPRITQGDSYYEYLISSQQLRLEQQPSELMVHDTESMIRHSSTDLRT